MIPFAAFRVIRAAIEGLNCQSCRWPGEDYRGSTIAQGREHMQETGHEVHIFVIGRCLLVADTTSAPPVSELVLTNAPDVPDPLDTYPGIYDRGE